MSINLTLIAQALAFASLIWLIATFVWPPLLKAIEERQQKIAEGLAAALAEIDASANRAREELRKQVSALAVGGAEKLLHREIDANAHKALLDELAAQL